MARKNIAANVALVADAAAAAVDQLPGTPVAVGPKAVREEPVTVENGAKAPSDLDLAVDAAYGAVCRAAGLAAAVAGAKASTAETIRVILAMAPMGRDQGLVRMAARIDHELSADVAVGQKKSPRNLAKDQLRAGLRAAASQLRVAFQQNALEQAKVKGKQLEVATAIELAVEAVPILTVKGKPGAYKVHVVPEKAQDNGSAKAAEVLAEWILRFIGDAPNEETAIETLGAAIDALNAAKETYL